MNAASPKVQSILNVSELETAINRLRESQKRLSNFSYKQIIAYLSEFGSHLSNRKLSIHKEYPDAGLAFIANFCRRTNLESMLKTALKQPAVLDGFVELSGSSGIELFAVPRGVVVHWIAGNVPTLGFLSLIQGLLTKNANIIKLPSNSNNLMPSLVEEMSGLHSELATVVGQSIQLIKHSRTDERSSKALSEIADVRVFWGSDSGVEALRQLPSKMSCGDLVFSNKVSLILLEGKALEDCDLSKLCTRIAQDVAIFEQKACASPHTIFLEAVSDKIFSQFVEALRESFKNIVKRYPRMLPSTEERSAILNLRAQYDMFHESYSPESLEFTLLSDNEIKLGPAIGGRTVFLRRLQNFSELYPLLSEKTQSVGILMNNDRYDETSKALAKAGIQRICRLGSMTQFDIPWDGYLILDRMLRWTSRPAL